MGWRKRKSEPEKENTKREINPNLRTPEGMIGIVSVGPELPPRPPMDRSIIAIKSLSEKIRNFECGHKGSKKVEIILYGESLIIEGKKFKPEDKSLCPDCLLSRLKEVCIQCALCGSPILPGEGVALYQKNNKTNTKWATSINNAVMGCLRMDCCPSGGFFTGHWTTNGFQPVFEGRTMAEEAMKRALGGDDGPLIVNL